eukprot:COSAG05_NODE_2872_length_2554_cov_2.243585_2_plen_517_part_00
MPRYPTHDGSTRNQLLFGTDCAEHLSPATGQRLPQDLEVQRSEAEAPPPPDFSVLEGRAVSAAFLERFTSERCTAQLMERATAAAIPFLETKIAEYERDVENNENTESAQQWLKWYRMDLAKRQRAPYLTARDVHRYIIKAATDDRMCRFCELPGVGEGREPPGRAGELGARHFGMADYFFSYNWDSPWVDVVDAIVTHSEEQVRGGKRAPYYWVDNFAINQHYRTSIEAAKARLAGEPGYDYDGPVGKWGMTTVACPPCPPCQTKIASQGWAMPCKLCVCTACRASSEDMPDWDRKMAAAPGEEIGFERVISFTRKTVMLNEPWDNPRAPTRVWCLFEANATLLLGGKLDAILGRGQRRQLQLALDRKLDQVQLPVRALDARKANATGEEDKAHIFRRIEQLDGGFDALNQNIRRNLLIFIANSALDVVERSRPVRSRLNRRDLAMEVQTDGHCSACVTRCLNCLPSTVTGLRLFGTLVLLLVCWFVSFLYMSFQPGNLRALSQYRNNRNMRHTR